MKRFLGKKSRLRPAGRYLLAAFCAAAILCTAACGGQKEYQLSGRTMGTTYHIKVVAGDSEDMVGLQAKIDALLERINQSMSTFRPDSEISRFNALHETGVSFAISPDFLRVMLAAREIYRLTDGAWDGTVDPLVNLWGFGKQGAIHRMPPADAIEAARKRVGFDRIEISVDGYLKKDRPDVSLDLASIAKGYGVDQTAILLHGLGFKQFVVEIGGEVYAAGLRPDGTPWRVGINRPSRAAAADDVVDVVRLRNGALATSGDYRNFYKIGDRIFSHVIDPRTGYPVENRVVSASVIADNCTLADGLATALMVMGPEKALALLDRLPGVEGLIIVRLENGKFEQYPSKGLQALMQ